MATNFVSSVMQFLTPDMIARIARTLGIDPDVAQHVVSAAVPAILASFAGLAAKPAGAQQLFETVQQQHPDILSQITSVIGGPDQKAIADTGSGLLSTLLGGSGLNGLVSAISTFAGINQNASRTVLGLIAPMVLGALGQQQRSGGLDANGLANLLSSQKDQITAAMPSGLANMVGARGMLDALDGGLRRGADTASAAAGIDVKYGLLEHAGDRRDHAVRQAPGTAAAGYRRSQSHGGDCGYRARSEVTIDRETETI